MSNTERFEGSEGEFDGEITVVRATEPMDTIRGEFTATMRHYQAQGMSATDVYQGLMAIESRRTR